MSVHLSIYAHFGLLLMLKFSVDAAVIVVLLRIVVFLFIIHLRIFFL